MGGGINTGLKKADGYGMDDVAQYRFVECAENAPLTVWTTTRGTGYHSPHHWTVYRSDDAGATWRYTFTGSPVFAAKNCSVLCGWGAWERSWGFGGPPTGFSVCAANRDAATYTNYGELFITLDGGRSWYNGFCRTADGGPEEKHKYWTSTALTVTTCWEVVFDPHRPGYACIAYTDIGFARSEGWGRPWRWSARGWPWSNTFYGVICTPAARASCTRRAPTSTTSPIGPPSKGHGAGW